MVCCSPIAAGSKTAKPIQQAKVPKIQTGNMYKDHLAMLALYVWYTLANLAFKTGSVKSGFSNRHFMCYCFKNFKIN
jgi:hypothetical protein